MIERIYQDYIHDILETAQDIAEFVEDSGAGLTVTEVVDLRSHSGPGR